MLVDQGLELLSEVTAWDLLAHEDVGRVGISIGALPAILPVNFAVIDGCIVFRTAPGSKLSAAARGAVVAFEVDCHENSSRSGWSVLVVGHAEVVHGVDAALDARAAKLEPYVDGVRSSLVRIRPEFVSGRRLVHDERHPATPTVVKDVVYVTDSVDQPFADVCRVLAEAQFLVPGSVVAVSDSMATLDLGQGSEGGETAELRILPLRGGNDAITELLLISEGEAASPTHHSKHVLGARSQLADIMKTVEASSAAADGKTVRHPS